MRPIFSKTRDIALRVTFTTEKILFQTIIWASMSKRVYFPFKVMSAVGLLSSCPNPDIEDLGRGLQGNLCRCTGYRPILSSLANLCSKTERELDRPEALSLNREAERLRAEVECTELELESTEQVELNFY